MKVAVDENIPLSVVEKLRNQGWDVLDIRGTPNEGMDDPDFWNLVQSDHRIFITTDKGFAQYREQSHAGLLIVTLKQPNTRKIHQRVFQALEQFEEWTGRMVVMRDTVQSVWFREQ